MVASKRVMHKPKKAKNDELERMAAAARKISIAWKHAKLRKPLLQVRRSHAVGIVWRCASMGFCVADGACGAQCIEKRYVACTALQRARRLSPAASW